MEFAYYFLFFERYFIFSIISNTLFHYFNPGQFEATHLHLRFRFVWSSGSGKTLSHPGCYSTHGRTCSVVLILGPCPNPSMAVVGVSSDAGKHSFVSVQSQSAAHFSNQTTLLALSRIGQRRIRLGTVICFDRFTILSIL